MLAKTSGKSDDSAVEGGYLAGSVSVEEEKLLICIADGRDG